MPWKPVNGRGLDQALADSRRNPSKAQHSSPTCNSSAEWFAETEQAQIIEWLSYGFISKGDAHLLVAPAKEGKSSALAALLVANLLMPISDSEECIGSVLWFSDDQARAKTTTSQLLPRVWGSLIGKVALLT